MSFRLLLISSTPGMAAFLMISVSHGLIFFRKLASKVHGSTIKIDQINLMVLPIKMEKLISA